MVSSGNLALWDQPGHLSTHKGKAVSQQHRCPEHSVRQLCFSQAEEQKGCLLCCLSHHSHGELCWQSRARTKQPGLRYGSRVK